MQGTPVSIKLGSKTDIVYVHPDGVVIENQAQLALKLERVQRAARRVDQLRKRLAGGTLSRDEWEVEQEKLEKQMAEGMAKIEGQLKAGEISRKEFDDSKRANEVIYKQEVAALLNQRDGEPISLEEEDALSAELEEWLKRATIKPFAVPMLKSCILSWSLQSVGPDGRPNGEPLPLTYEGISSLPEDYLKVLFTQISNHYQADEAEEKKHTGNSESLSVTERESVEPSLNGFRSLELPEPTELTPTRLVNGDSENSLAHLQN